MRDYFYVLLSDLEMRILHSPCKNFKMKHVSTRTVYRYLNEHKYKYLQLRNKGLLTAKDKTTRLHFARNSDETFTRKFWRDGIQFYFH